MKISQPLLPLQGLGIYRCMRLQPVIVASTFSRGLRVSINPELRRQPQ